MVTSILQDAAASATPPVSNVEGQNQALNLAFRALATAQRMEEAIRQSVEPLADIPGPAFPILSAVQACLDTMAREVDPAIEHLSRLGGDEGELALKAIPRDVAYQLNATLFDALTLLYAAENQPLDPTEKPEASTDGGLACATSRHAALVGMTRSKVVAALDAISDYI